MTMAAMRETRLSTPSEPETAQAVPRLSVEGLSVEFRLPLNPLAALLGRKPLSVRAVDGVNFSIAPGETLGLVGESGSGKTTVGRALLGLVPATAGVIKLDGRDLGQMSPAERKLLPRQMQMVFQDPYGSLNPRLSIGSALGEVLKFHGAVGRNEVAAEVKRLLALVGLPEALAARRPRHLSGGQRQRVGLARALAVKPTMLVLDEPVAALDVSIQAQVLNLLQDLRRELGLTMLFIAHELGVVRHISERVAVMYLGRIVEIGTTDEVFASPRHPYTQGLLKAMPRLVPEKRQRPPVLQGEVPSPLAIPTGCRFRTRCPLVQPICETPPPEVSLSASHKVACHFTAR